MKGGPVQDAGRLMARVRERDTAAFEALYETHQRLVYGVAMRMLDDASAAEDVVQSVFLALWNRPDSFREGNFTAWIGRVARNRCLDILRARKVRNEDAMAVDVAGDCALDDEIFARLDGDRVRAALASLPEEQRKPIEMGFFEGVTHDEIARRTGIPLGTIKTRIRTGLHKLRDQLQGAVVR
jgi:RNA polymerase sigma-70 factor (ECF subfamily)